MPLEVPWSTRPTCHFDSSHPCPKIVHTSGTHGHSTCLGAFEEALLVRGGDSCGSTRVRGHVTRAQSNRSLSNSVRATGVRVCRSWIGAWVMVTGVGRMYATN